MTDTSDKATQAGARLASAEQQKLMFVTYTRGLSFTAKAMGLPEDAVMSALRGDVRLDTEINHINKWLQERVS